ncbi:MAG TPA: hypothetical protein VN804_00685 [Solirubrobacteraceae bacterium]|nr:hypothetical protein [Solirubrobacteraceae bacterium]
MHALEQLLGDDRLVQSLDRATAVALAADVAAVGGVAEHFANAVFAERTIARRARAGRVQPARDRHVRFLAADVALEGFEHERSALRVGDRQLAARVAHVAERELADEVTLARLLLQAAAHPEGERDGVVLVEHLVDRLGEERRWVGVVFTHRLRDRDDADAELLAEHLLVAARLDLVAREARGVKDEHDVELAGGSVGHQALELRPRGGLAPAGVKVAVLADQLQVVLGSELADALALGVGREALALLLGRLADVGDRAKRRVRHRLGWRR